MKKFLVFCVVMTIFVLSIPVTGMNGYSRIVYNVSGIQNYSLHWNDRFPPDSNLNIYVEADGVNHRRLVSVDYVFIIRDSNFNIVDTQVFENRRRNYDDNDFVVFTRQINSAWEDGFYTTQIHIFDLLNDSLAEQYYDNVTSTLINQLNESDTLPDVPHMNRGFIRNNSDLDASNHKVIIQRFWIDRYADKYPANRFVVKNLGPENLNVAPNEEVNMVLDLENNFNDNGTVLLDILLDGQKVDNMSVNIGAFSSKKSYFNISSDIVEKHIVEIIPISKNTMGYNLLSSFNVIEQETRIPTMSNYEDLTIDNFTVIPNQIVNITVTVRNKGRQGSIPVGILINDVPATQQTVFLNTSEVKDVKFNVSEKDLGEYRVSVNNSNLEKVFFVTPKVTTPVPTVVVTPTEAEKKMSNLYTVLGLSIIVILLIIARIYLKRNMKK